MIGYGSVIKAVLSKTPATDDVLKEFMLEHQEVPPHADNLGGPAVVDLLSPHTFFLWDRLGRAGRCPNPQKQHYNPDTIAALAEQKVREVKLPIKGHEVNPIELLNNFVQREVASYDGSIKKGVGAHSFKECEMAVSQALEKLKWRPDIIKGWYRVRGDGVAIQERWKVDPVARKVRRVRQASNNPTVFRWPARL